MKIKMLIIIFLSLFITPLCMVSTLWANSHEVHVVFQTGGDVLVAREFKDRFEKESTDFHKAVRKGYLCLAKSDSKIWTVIDGQKSTEDISEIIWKEVQKII